MMKALVVIPARYGSTRLPGKALVEIKGKPLIQHVYENACRSRLAEKTIVATDDERILVAVTASGGEAVMTSSSHPSGTDRIAEVVRGQPCDIVVNLQGDEPMIRPEMIDDVISILLEDERADMGTLVKPIDTVEEALNPNVVKAVIDRHGYAMYFSRSPIPYYRDLFAMKPARASGSDHVFQFSCPDYNYRFLKHIGIYSYRRDILLQLTDLPPSDLEIAERLEQLRALQHGFRIKVRETPYDTVGVDTSEDLELIKSLMERKDRGGHVQPQE